MPARSLYLWNKAPALRGLLPFATGIVAQWHLALPATAIFITALGFFLLLLTFLLLPAGRQFVLKPFYGLLLNLLLVTAGAAAVWMADIRNNPDWFGHEYQPEQLLLVTLQEPVVAKPNSYKALAAVQATSHAGNWQPAKGKIILYFKKDEPFSKLLYGQQLVVTRPLQPIKNTGNPGSFDYRRYCLFQGITHQAYVTENDVVLLSTAPQKDLKAFTFGLRAWVLSVLRRYIPGPQELGLAEALLIGYRDDLDKALVQAYTNTGVVHVIAISGLHLGLIYGLLLLLTRPLQGKRWTWLRVLLILAALWLFTLLAGAQASVVRSAVMFTVLALGQVLNRRAYIYNTLALSALILLLINPFWLWDVGFQLSYAAVLSIIIFYQPVYNWIYFQNKALDAVWKLAAVTLAAQLLTTPFSLYHFHQFPLLFFISNLVAVPLSSAILFGEILLCAVSFIKPVAEGIGWLLQRLIAFLNNHMLQLSSLPFANWQNLSISFWQAVLLLALVAAVGYWLLHKNKESLYLATTALVLFTGLRTTSFMMASKQKKIIVYNIPRHQAIDIVDGRNLLFIGDRDVETNESLKNYHLTPARVQLRARHRGQMFQKAFDFQGRKIVVIDSTVSLPLDAKPVVHLLILSKNPNVYLHQLQQAFTLNQVIIDASVPPWKARLWQRDCDSLRIDCYNVAEKGAFVMQL